jgi:hypothetical protein
MPLSSKAGIDLEKPQCRKKKDNARMQVRPGSTRALSGAVLNRAWFLFKEALSALAPPFVVFRRMGRLRRGLNKGEQSQNPLPLGYEQVARLLGGCEKREYLLGDVPGLQFTL